MSCCIFHSKIAAPKKALVKSLKIPPQEELIPITDLSVFAFTQVIVGGFQIIDTISSTRWYDGGINRLCSKSTSPITQLLVEFTPDMVTKVEIIAKVL